VVLTKFARSEIATLSFHESHLSSGPHKIYKSRDGHSFLLLSSFGSVVLTTFTRAENASLSLYLFHLVLWSSRNLPELWNCRTFLLDHLVLWSSHNLLEQWLPLFPTVNSFWSCGPHEIVKIWDCHTFLSWISFGPLVLTTFTRTDNVTLFLQWSSFGLMVLTKYTRAEIPHFPTVYPIWSYGHHEIYNIRECPSFLLMSSFGPTQAFTKLTTIVI
jgi:hypothetical protein